MRGESDADIQGIFQEKTGIDLCKIQINSIISTLSCLEYNPRHDFLIFLMRMLGIIAYIMRFAVGGAIETVALATGDVDSIGETVFAQGIGEIPEGFGMTGLYII